MIRKEEYEKIFKHSISDTHLDATDEYGDFAEYRGELYSGIGFSDSIFTEILTKLVLYKNGLKDGICREWHDNGFIKQEALEMGMSNGYRRKWDKKGNLIFEGIFINGLCIYERKLNENGRREELIYTRNIKFCRDMYNEGNLKRAQVFSKKIEKNSKDSKYINSILAIFEKYKDDTSENVIDKIGSEILKFSEEQKTMRDSDYCMFHRVVKEEEVEVKDNIAFYNNEPYTGITSKFIDDDSISSIVLVLCQYLGHKKSNFFMLHF
ncbi:hypothetical protein [Clostridium sp. VAP23]|uniref:hypothetical protein n=1 Tax=Clostridium sp. VAP23 TaxID=2949981 RepID=UPI00207B0392|nr:hypothetical protein [Clostridium sp. VAP23]